jgi:hypothetical protein
MTPDDRADVLEELEEEVADDILDQMPPEEREETEQLAAYDPYTAGGLMTTEFVKAPENLTVEAALRGVRRIARSGRREAMHAVYVTDPRGALSGVLSLRELLAAPEGVGDERRGARRGAERARDVVAGGRRAHDREVRPRRRAGGRTTRGTSSGSSRWTT